MAGGLVQEDFACREKEKMSEIWVNDYQSLAGRQTRNTKTSEPTLAILICLLSIVVIVK